MALAKRLYVALSGHGFGHLAQVAPVLNAASRAGFKCLATPLAEGPVDPAKRASGGDVAPADRRAV